MAYYDQYGWYCDELIEGRATEAEPENTSITTTPGELRANWTGHEWVDRPYVGHDDTNLMLQQTKRQAITTLKHHRDMVIAAPLGGFEVSTPEDRENIQGAIDYYYTLTASGTVDLVWTHG